MVLSACHPAGAPAPEEGDVGAARLAQLDPRFHDWQVYCFETDQRPLFDILVIGDEDVGGFQRNTEYLYVHSERLPDLGEADIHVSHTSGEEEPPPLSGEQELTQPVYLDWESFSTDPVGVGELYSNAAKDIHFRIKVDSNEIVRVVWYQTTSSQSPANVTPSGTFEPVGGSVSVPAGEYGYYVDATIE